MYYEPRHYSFYNKGNIKKYHICDLIFSTIAGNVSFKPPNVLILNVPTYTREKKWSGELDWNCQTRTIVAIW